ncbi:MAG TPA: FtsW/RodA/SpoVE family cell cycle protein [Anaerolineae bacterium]|nr:FtsW/RodA/SpoVE family cell cycle protein [Anaerolineae bacterium]
MSLQSALRTPQSALENPQLNNTQPIETAYLWSRLPINILRERVLLVLAGAFTLSGFVLLELISNQEHLTFFIVNWSVLIAFLVWSICFTAIHLHFNRRVRGRDPFLLPIAALLTGWGLIEVARLAPGYLSRQVIWLIVGSSALIAITWSPANLKWLRRYRYTWLIGGLFLLALTFVIGVNPEGSGLRLWLGGLAGVFFQPSEMLKLLFVAFLASYLAEKREIAQSLQIEHQRFLTAPYLAPLIAMWAVALILLIGQQDLGTAILLYLTFLVMLYLASSQPRYLLVGVLLLIVAGLIGFQLIGRVRGRVSTWIDPWTDSAGSSYQIVQSLIALGSGGAIGSGLGQGSPDIILPAAHTDMPLAAIGEEFGLIGTLAVVICFSLLTLRGLRAALRARTTYGQLLAAGLATSIGVQAWIIMAGNANVAPLTGVTLPFVSYGGSSLLVSFLAIGLLSQISADRD